MAVYTIVSNQTTWDEPTRGSRMVMLSNGYLYAILNRYGSTTYTVYIYKSTNNGQSWSQVGSATSTDMYGGAYVTAGIEACLDGAGYIHVVGCAGLQTRDIAYNRFNTANDSWAASWEQAANLTAFGAGNEFPSIAVDSNNKPHVAYIDYVTSMGGQYSQVKYVNKTGASWTATPEVVGPAPTAYSSRPKILVRNSDIVEVMFYENDNNNYYRVRTSGSWGSITQLHTSVSADYDVTSDTSGNVYRYEATASGFTENGVDVGVTDRGGGSYPSLSVFIYYNGKRIIIYKTGETTYKETIYSGGAWCTPFVIRSSTNNYVASMFGVRGYNLSLSNNVPVFHWEYKTGSPPTYYFLYNDAAAVEAGIKIDLASTPATTATSKANPTVQIQFKGLVTIQYPAVAATSGARGDILKGYLIAPPAAWTVPVARFPYPKVRIGYVQVYTSSGVVVPVNSATITTAAQPVAPSSPAIVSLNVTSLSSTAQGVSVIPGAISQTFTVASLVASPQSVSVLVADTTVTLSSLTLSAQPQSLSVGANTFVVLNASELTTSAQGVEMSLGPVSSELQVASLITQPQPTSLSLGATGVQLNAATLQAQAGNLTIFFDVIVQLSAPEISSYALGVTLESIIVLTFNTASISASAQPISIDGGLVYVGVLKRWTGADWVPEPLKVYLNSTWQSKPLRVYVDGQWKEVDISG